MSQETRALRHRRSVSIRGDSSINNSQKSDMDMEEAGAPESQNSQPSQSQHTGLSLDMEKCYVMETVDDVERAVMVPSLSIGTVCVVHREARGRMKEVKPFALPNTFFAYPKDATTDMKEKISNKIQVVADNFSIQSYKTDIVRFGLPFAVSEVCSISSGYNMTPKRMIAVAASATNARRKKRKLQDSSSNSSDNESKMDLDDTIEEDQAPAKSSSRATRRSK